MVYYRIVCNVRPQKAETNRTRLTFGENNISVDMDCGTPTADLLTVTLLLNSVLSTPGTKFTTLDIKDFYQNTPRRYSTMASAPPYHLPAYLN